jgi:signal transduction histidine kinase
VQAETTRLKQVLLNLVSNAIKYNRRGGDVTVQVQRLGPHWRIAVRDNGVGISLARQAHLFKAFDGLGQEASPVDGMGIGLVITRELVLAMGGELQVQSEPGAGTEFRVELQADDAATAAPAGD